MSKRIIDSIPRLGTCLGYPPTHLWEHFYFHKISDEMHQAALALAKRISEISRGRKTRLLSDNPDIIGKIGEFVVSEFCGEYLNCRWSSFAEVVNSSGGDDHDLEICGLGIDVKTRQLHEDVTIAPNFDLRVPQTELSKYQDVYILAGFCPSTMYGYVLGWCTWEELQSQPIRTDIKFPAKCMALVDLHPMLEIEDYILKTSGESNGV
jgi:hypothetical protein